MFEEDAAGQAKLLSLLGSPADILVAMEATGHYWKNLFVALAAGGFSVALINPLRTHRFAQEDLERTKTDAIDALSIARFAAQKRPPATRLPDQATEELRELVRHRGRLVQHFGDRVRQLHRLVDLGFPELTRYIRRLDSELASAVLHDFPTAQALQGVTVRRLARPCYDGRHRVGEELARSLIEAAKVSVGHHHGFAYRIQVRHACEDLDVLRRRLRELEHDIERFLKEHEVGSLLTTINGIGVQTSARPIAELGDPALFRNSAALAAYVGPVPALKQSGKKQHTRAGITTIGNASLRAALWMPTLTAVQKNPWLRAHYQRLIARGKPPKLALVACTAQAPHRRLQRRQKPSALRPNPSFGARAVKRPLTNHTVSQRALGASVLCVLTPIADSNDDGFPGRCRSEVRVPVSRSSAKFTPPGAADAAEMCRPPTCDTACPVASDGTTALSVGHPPAHMAAAAS